MKFAKNSGKCNALKPINLAYVLTQIIEADASNSMFWSDLCRAYPCYHHLQSQPCVRIYTYLFGCILESGITSISLYFELHIYIANFDYTHSSYINIRLHIYCKISAHGTFTTRDTLFKSGIWYGQLTMICIRLNYIKQIIWLQY